MTAAPANVTQPTGDLRAKGVKFQPNCSHCRESSRSQVWLPLLLLSFVSAYACVASELRTEDLKPCLTGLRNAIEKSDAMLYSPSPNDIQSYRHHPSVCAGARIRSNKLNADQFGCWISSFQNFRNTECSLKNGAARWQLTRRKYIYAYS
ncbi:interleukin-15 isoform X2 [Nelusetta ayraudi]|uniref:interleukin-15 isoform X2 n=1 Tax=Nelusetta ayraudi TaxID=303726 RepID=UPI003F6F2D47